nr:hypothetical protein B0A51_00573 [Rachicladosporium sp. CCFEE 5018]
MGLRPHRRNERDPVQVFDSRHNDGEDCCKGIIHRGLARGPKPAGVGDGTQCGADQDKELSLSLRREDHPGRRFKPAEPVECADQDRRTYGDEEFGREGGEQLNPDDLVLAPLMSIYSARWI